MLTAVELSGYVALGAVALLGVNLFLGLLLAAGYNPVRHWPRRRIKLFTLHNWTGYTAAAGAILHPAILLFSSKPRFRVIDILAPIDSPVQPTSNTLGAIALYLVLVVVVTSYFRRALGRHRWKTIHYSTYAAAAVFFVHGVIADPTVTGRAVDYLDGEKVFIEGCALLVIAATFWRVQHRRALRRQT
jgi:DMSO/TMAO reductase YedYZ heme-binding membrane subunit